MGLLIHINGAPGVGKLTIARAMAPVLKARILDNHAIYNVAFGLTDFATPQFFEAVRSVRSAAYAQILQLPDSETIILTDAYFDDSDWAVESWEAIEHLAEQRGWPFLTIALHCDAIEHRRRITAEDRAARGKLRDASYVDRAAQRRLITRPGNLALQLDATNLPADKAASTAISWIESVIAKSH